MKKEAVNYFMNGYSCSESIIKAASEEGLCPKEFLSAASAFSGGMSSGCLCGAVAAAQIINGYYCGRENIFGNDNTARPNAARIVEEFKKRNKFTCCRVLSAGLQGMARKKHCSKYVADACDILKEVMDSQHLKSGNVV